MALVLHAASLCQACAHCRRFPTAASRRSLGRVSVPMWLAALSGQLLILALVGYYPHQLANQPQAHPQTAHKAFPRHLLRPWGFTGGFPPLYPIWGQVPTCYSPVRHGASAPYDLHVLGTPTRVHPEPGSNSQSNFPGTGARSLVAGHVKWIWYLVR